jgi:ribosome-associated protein
LLPTPEPEPLEAPDTNAPELLARLGAEKLAEDIVVLGVREVVHYADWFVIMSARSNRHVAALREALETGARDELGLRPTSVEGGEHNQWVLMDYGDIVVHIFYGPVREYYRLESLWSGAEPLHVELPEVRPAAEQ